MSRLIVERKKGELAGGQPFLLLRWQGIVSRASVDISRKALAAATKEDCAVLLDLSAVRYVDAAGLKKFVLFIATLEGRGYPAAICGLNALAVELAQMLHLTKSLRSFADAPAAQQYLAAPRQEQTISARRVISAVTHNKVALQGMPPPRLPAARIFIGFAPDDLLGKMLRRSLGGDSAQIILSPEHAALQEALAAGPVHIAVLDATLKQYQQLALTLKTHPRNGLSSVIAAADKPPIAKGLQLLPDVEIFSPFAAQDLFAAAEAEFERCEFERLILNREINFSFTGTPKATAKAQELTRHLIALSGLPETMAAGYLQAIFEAYENAQRHGNKGVASKPVQAEFLLDKEKVTVLVRDAGEGFNFLPQLKKALEASVVSQMKNLKTPHEHTVLGLHTMLLGCDSVEYLLPGNVVKLVKYL